MVLNMIIALLLEKVKLLESKINNIEINAANNFISLDNKSNIDALTTQANTIVDNISALNTSSDELSKSFITNRNNVSKSITELTTQANTNKTNIDALTTQASTNIEANVNLTKQYI